MNLVISIENATAQTPTVSGINLTNADWVTTQELRVGQSMPGGGRIVGMLDATMPFHGNITLHYTFDGATNGAVDVDFTIDGRPESGLPLVGCGAMCKPANAFPNTEWDTVEENGDYHLMLKVQ